MALNPPFLLPAPAPLSHAPACPLTAPSVFPDPLVSLIQTLPACSQQGRKSREELGWVSQGWAAPFPLARLDLISCICLHTLRWLLSPGCLDVCEIPSAMFKM